MKQFSCVIFDLDGTVTQTNELIFASFNHITEKYCGVVYTPTEIVAMFGPPEEIALEKLVGKDKIHNALEDFFQFYSLHHNRMAKVHDGISDVLVDLKNRGIRLAVFTGKGRKSTIISLEALGILHYFDMLVTGSDVTKHKPSSEGITKILTSLGIDAQAALMVGDAVGDVKAAREAGVSIASVLWDSYGKEEVMKLNSDYQFHHVKDFAAWLPSVLGSNGGNKN